MKCVQRFKVDILTRTLCGRAREHPYIMIKEMKMNGHVMSLSTFVGLGLGNRCKIHLFASFSFFTKKRSYQVLS